MDRSTPYHYFKRQTKNNDWIKNHKEALKEENLELLLELPLHGLKYSGATLPNYLGVNIIDISNVLGHTQTSITMNIYAHSFEEQKRVASDKSDDFLRKSV